MLPSERARAAVVRHVLALTLRREGGVLAAAATAASHRAYSTAAQVADHDEGNAELVDLRTSSSSSSRSRSSSTVTSSQWSPPDYRTSYTPPPAQQTTQIHDRQRQPLPARHWGPLQRPPAIPPSPSPHPNDLVLHNQHFHKLLGCVPALVPRDALPPPRKRKMTSPRHAARCSFPPFDVPPLLVPGFVPSEVIALLPPGTHDAWASALTATLEEVARAVPILLWERPTSPHEWHERLDWVRTYLARLTPKFPERWAGLPPSRHAALLHLWKEMLAGIEVLWDADALPRRFGDEGRLTQPAAFTPLFHLLTTQPGVVRRLEPRDQRLRVRPPTDPPTLERALAIMRMLGHAPTASQRMLLVTKLPIAEILIRAADINVEAEHNLNAVAAGIAADIMTPPLYDAASERDRRYAPEMAANPDASKRYMWAVAERALDQIERAAQLEREPSAHWTDVVAHCRTAWEETAGDIAVRFSAGAADAEELSALEAFALWLLIRDVLLRSPRTELRADPHIVGNYNLGSALDLLDLLLNSPSASSYDAASQAASNAAAAAEYAATAAVRIAHAAAHRRLFAPVPELAILLAERRTPVRARTALFLAGSARRPEHLAQLLPLLSHIVVEAPRGDESRHVVRALLALGREGDAEAGETGEMKLERRTSALLTSWLGPLSEL